MVKRIMIGAPNECADLLSRKALLSPYILESGATCAGDKVLPRLAGAAEAAYHSWAHGGGQEDWSNFRELLGMTEARRGARCQSD